MVLIVVITFLVIFEVCYVHRAVCFVYLIS